MALPATNGQNRVRRVISKSDTYVLRMKNDATVASNGHDLTSRGSVRTVRFGKVKRIRPKLFNFSLNTV